MGQRLISQEEAVLSVQNIGFLQTTLCLQLSENWWNLVLVHLSHLFCLCGWIPQIQQFFLDLGACCVLGQISAWFQRNNGFAYSLSKQTVTKMMFTFCKKRFGVCVRSYALRIIFKDAA